MKAKRILSPLFVNACILLLFAVLCGLTGCLSRPVLKEQSFSFSLSPAGVTNVAKGKLVLGVRSLQIAAPFDDRSLVYRTGEYTFERDPYAEFLEPPADELRAVMEEWFSGTSEFRAVTEPGSAIKSDILVDVYISRMYGDFRQPKHPKAVIVIRFGFLDAPAGISGKVISEKVYKRSIPLSEPSAAASMAGWNEALSQILADVSFNFRLPDTRN